MSMASERFRDALSNWFLPGRLYTFVGAGGKTTGMKRIAELLLESGLKIRLTTTTRLGVDEFTGWAITEVREPAGLSRAIADDAPSMLLVGGTAHDQGKYRGVDPTLLEGLSVPTDAVLLVEGDGSRKRPMKAPKGHEPVITANTSTVFAVMGASAFDGPIDEAHCYNHHAALALAGTSTFEPAAVSALAASPGGSRKGVLPGMAFRLLVNQGDLAPRRVTASAALRLAREMHGIRGALVSFQKGDLYDTTED